MPVRSTLLDPRGEAGAENEEERGEGREILGWWRRGKGSDTLDALVVYMYGTGGVGSALVDSGIPVKAKRRREGSHACHDAACICRGKAVLFVKLMIVLSHKFASLSCRRTQAGGHSRAGPSQLTGKQRSARKEANRQQASFSFRRLLGCEIPNGCLSSNERALTGCALTIIPVQ